MISPFLSFLSSSSLLLLYVLPYLLPPWSASKLQFLRLRGLFLVVEGEVRVRLTGSDVGRMRFLSQGLSLGGGREELDATTLNTLSTAEIY
jgi:hypothetical protein